MVKQLFNLITNKMQQINENLVVITAGEPWEEAMNDYLKIYLGGSIDLGEKFNWHGKFIQGMTKLTDPISGDPRYNDKKFLIMSPRVPVMNPSPTLDNVEFVNKKGLEEVEQIDDTFTEEDYSDLVDVNSNNNVEINGTSIKAPDFLEIVYDLFVKKED